MTDLPKIEAELRAGLDGVTPGPYVARETTINGVGYGNWTVEGIDPDPEDIRHPERLVPITGSGGALSFTTRIIDTQIHDDNEANSKHFARCSPEVIRAILDDKDAMRAEIDRLRAALEEIAYFDALRQRVKELEGR